MNSESAQSSNKRLFDNDDLSQPEKQFKQENRIILKDNNYLQKSEEETINLACTEKSCEIKESKNRNTYTDFIAKFEIPFEELEKEKTTFIEKLTSKNKETYNISLSNILYEGTVSSSLIFLFQNKSGLSDEKFEKEVSAYENNFILKNLEEEKTNQINLNSLIPQEGNHENIIESHILENREESRNHVGENEEVKNFKIGDNDLRQESQEKKMNIIEDNEQMDIEDNKILDRADDCKQHDIITDKVYKTLLGVYYKQNEDPREKSSKIINNQKLHNNENSMPSNTNNPTTLINIEKITEISVENTKDTYDIQINLYLLDFKIIQKTFQKVQEAEILEIRMDIPSNFYREFKGEGVSIVSEVIIRKNYDSVVNYNGIINEAMTCYMNSLIQTLFHIGYFRRAVFQIPLDSNETQGESVVYSLQRLFYDLMQEKSPASTNKLINSFGWSREEIFIQHDVQEFNLMLNDLMENKMKGTKSEGTFKYLFEGTSENYIECLEVPYRSIKVEKFYDLQLTVKNCKNIYESLQKFTEVETLEGDNMYEAEGHGKQRAKKGVRFSDFPKVLMFQLKRFEYNPIKDSMEKINEMFEFPDQLNLDEFVLDKDPNSNENEKINEENKQKIKYEYSLYSVVVHKGTIDRGHYYAFIKPENQNQWYQFNDEIVRKADSYEVFANNYGGHFKIFRHKERGIINEITQKSDGNAYLLVYIRYDLLGEILQKVTEEDIPQTLIERFNKEKEYERRQTMLRIRSKKNIDIHLFSKEMLLNHSNLGAMPSILELQDVIDLLSNNSFWNKISVPKEMKIIELRDYISKTLNIPEKYILLYTYVLRDQKNIYKNILKRHEFKMHLIEESAMREQKILNINSYNESRPVFRNPIFIFIDFALKNPKELLQNKLESNYNLTENEKDLLQNLDLKVFEKNELFEIEKDKIYEDIAETEYIIDEALQKMIYYKYDNKWKFKTLEDIPLNVFDILKYNDNDYDNFRLFIFKDFFTIANETRINIINAFSIPVDNHNDKFIIEKLINSTFSNRIDIYKLAEKLKKEDFKDLNIGVYLETTVFEPETSELLKKLFFVTGKKELKFFEDFKRKFISNSVPGISNNNLMDIEDSDPISKDGKSREIETNRCDNSRLHYIDQNKNFNSFDTDDRLNSQNIQSSIYITGKSMSKHLEENLNLNREGDKQETNCQSPSKKPLGNKIDEFNKERKTTNGKEYDSQNKNENHFDRVHKQTQEKEESNYKTLSLYEQENKSQSSLKSEQRTEKSHINSQNSSEIQESNNNLSLCSEEGKSLKENSLSNSNKSKNSPSNDTNSMKNNHDSFSQENPDKRNLNREQTPKYKESSMRNPVSNSNGRIKTYRKVLSARRNMTNEKEITYKNLSNFNREDNYNEEGQERNNSNENGNGGVNRNSINCQNADVNIDEENDILSPEDEMILQQQYDPSGLDQFLFSIDLITAEKIKYLSYFSTSNENHQILNRKNDRKNENSHCQGNSDSNNLLKDNQCDYQLEFDSNLTNNHSWDCKNQFQSFRYKLAFNKTNSDALIFYLFPEKDSNLIIVNQTVPKPKLAEYFDDQYNSLYIPIEFIFTNKLKDLYGPKGNQRFKLRLDEDYESILNIVVKYFRFNLEHFNLEQIFIQDEITQNILFYSERQELMSLETFLNNVTKENFHIRRNINLDQIGPNSNAYNLLSNIIAKYPLIQLMDSKDAYYKLTLHLLPIKLKNIRTFSYKDITLYDIDNNPMIKIYFVLPNSLNECNEFLTYIKDKVLKVFYSDILCDSEDELDDDALLSENVSNSIHPQAKSNSQTTLNRQPSDEMALENNSKNYFATETKNTNLNLNDEISKKNLNYKNQNRADSIDDSKDNMIIFNDEDNEENSAIDKTQNNPNKEKRISIKLENFKFMLQHQKRLFAYDIFVRNDEELFKYEKCSLNISYRIQPLRNEDFNLLKQYEKIFVAFCRRDSSAFCDPIIISLPNETTIGEMKKVIFNKLKKMKTTQGIEYSKIKYYIYSLIDYRPHKDYLLINSRDEEKIAQFFKKGPRNVLVELLQIEGETSGKELNMTG